MRRDAFPRRAHPILRRNTFPERRNIASVRGIRVAAAALLCLFMPALGICGSVAPLTSAVSFCPMKAAPAEACPMEGTAESGGTSPEDCPMSHRDSVPASCRACDPGSALPSRDDGVRTKTMPAASAVDSAATKTHHVPIYSGGTLRLAILAASPPLNLLHETFRN